MLGTIRQHAKWFCKRCRNQKMYLTVSHTEDGGMNFSYHYQTAHLEEHDMELLYYYMMRILFKGDCRAGYEHRRDYGTGIRNQKYEEEME